MPPLFISGAPRSGTTLLAAMIGSHPDYAIGPETQFFSKLSLDQLAATVRDPAWPEQAVARLCSLTLAGQNVLDLFETTPSEVSAFLSEREPSIAAMLEALCVPFARSRGKQGWAEKTPNHLLSLEAIRREWPDARIIRIMRDPRDAALSTCQLPTFRNSFAANIYLWRQWQDEASGFLDHDRLSHTIRYESLVLDPDRHLRQMCAAVRIDFHPAMLDFAARAKDVGSAAETWKQPVGGELDPSRLFAWKSRLGEADRLLANNVTQEYLVAFDYERAPPAGRCRKAYRLSPEFVEWNEATLHRHLANGTRWLPAASIQEADLMLEQPPYHRTRSPTKQPHGLNAPLIVTLTSYPPRFAHLSKTLRSLLDQTVAADHTILWIAHADIDRLPHDVLVLRDHGLEICACEDLRSYKKLVPAWREDPARYFVAADDDVYYPPHWLAGLVDTARQYPGNVIAWRAHEAPLDPAGAFTPYRDWRLATHRTAIEGNGVRLFPTGVGGVLYPPCAFAADLDNADLFMRLTPKGDDIWLFWQARAAGTGQRRVAGQFDVLEWPSTQDVALYADNLLGDGNDRKIVPMAAHFEPVP
jgi:hypothetical protein